jgi:transcriptional regulator with XRE-family HTH domain
MADRPDRPPSIVERDASGPFGRALAAALGARKIRTYRHAAHVLGFKGHAGVRAYVRGETIPEVETIDRIARSLRLPADVFLEAARAARALGRTRGLHEEPAPYATVRLDPDSVRAIVAELADVLLERWPPPPGHRRHAPGAAPEDSDPGAG